MLGVLQAVPPVVPYSTLPLDLLGVIVNKNTPSRSVCLVRYSYPSKREDVFQPGQIAFDLAEIMEINRDGVLIRNRMTNNPEFLTFEKRKPPKKSPPPAPNPRLAAISPDQVEVDLSSKTINAYLNNLPDLLNSAFAAPRYREGKNGGKEIQGFELSRIQEAGIVGQVGLKNGDVILEVNGELLDGLATVMRLLGRIQNESRVKMTVLRNGKKLNFVFNRK